MNTPNTETNTTMHQGGLSLDLLEAARSAIATAISKKLEIEPVTRIQKTITRPNKKGLGDLTFRIGNIQAATSGQSKEQDIVEAIFGCFQELQDGPEASDFSNCVESWWQPMDSRITVNLKVGDKAQIHDCFQELLDCPLAAEFSKFVESWTQPSDSRIDVNLKMGYSPEVRELFQELLGCPEASDFSSRVKYWSKPPGHIAVNLKVGYTAQILRAITQHDYLAKLTLPHAAQQQAMIEYSQPNTHKAFHAGHMRNVALGDCLVRLKEHCGHSVIAANYFGDEGAHVAKCLWRLKQKLEESNCTDVTDLNIPQEQRGEYLGTLYKEAVELVSLGSLTSISCPGAIVAKVLTKQPHPKKPESWNVCTLEIGSGKPVTVVCAGTDYEAGQLVAYMAIGNTFKKKEVVPTDMLGVKSTGMILGYSEVGVPNPNPPKAEKPQSKKSKKKKSGQEEASSICIVTTDGAAPGTSLTELGRFPDLNEPSDRTVEVILARRQTQVANVLAALESGDPEWCSLWDTTKQWSLDEFKNIYDWLGARFDVDFFESEVSQPSMQLVQEYLDKGEVFQEQQGAIGAVLDDYKLPFLMVVKSNGSGLYATKDLALAKRKFEEFKIDESIYVVDKAQSLHFQQVFATLHKMGFANADKSVHLAYGQVVRPEGKMSSRSGTVIYFSALKNALTQAIDEKFLNKYKEEGSWTEEQILEANRAIAVGTIRYGMLNVDPTMDITFELEAWTAKKGNTGPYLMYAYARIKSILSKATNMQLGSKKDVDVSLLSSVQDRSLLVHMTQFWPAVLKSASQCKPNELCKFLYVLAQEFMSWYEASPILKDYVPPELKHARLQFVEAVAAVLKTGIELLGMSALERM
ncbi:Arginine--tRNA ligase [Seminavis robusta]|uniref:arginine--tRNA ligase n=1 Tax=Seminavis robusta TaxID=568900 RepID=A0A9N8EQV8_9STRA|nr:Arginine--tRNA ligase [Seminavis robusta]|eukprot:Sro1438_g272690.1 Arginine--tRNA ligase (862) ;mRNA; r:15446-18031